MKVILFLFLFITSVRLETDICQFLKSSDSSFGVGLYHRLSGEPTNRMDSYFLFRRNQSSSTRMWDITIERDSTDEITVRLNGESVESIAENTTHAFSVEAIDNRMVWNCSIMGVWKTSDSTSDHKTYCESPTNTIVNQKNMGKVFVFRPKPSDSSLLMIVETSLLNYHTIEIRSDQIVLTESLMCETTSVCPLFLKSIRESTQLFEKLAGIVDFDVDNSSGHLLLFNINGEPKYCIHSYSAPNRSECTSETDLLSLAEHCYPSDGGLSDWAVFGILAAVLLFMIAITCFVIHYMWRTADNPVLRTKKSKNESESTFQRITESTDHSTTEATAGPSTEMDTQVRPNSSPVGRSDRPSALKRPVSSKSLPSISVAARIMKQMKEQRK